MRCKPLDLHRSVKKPCTRSLEQGEHLAVRNERTHHRTNSRYLPASLGLPYPFLESHSCNARAPIFYSTCSPPVTNTMHRSPRPFACALSLSPSRDLLPYALVIWLPPSVPCPSTTSMLPCARRSTLLHVRRGRLRRL